MIKNTACSSRGPGFKSQQLDIDGGSQPSIMGTDALFCHAGIHADRALICINKYVRLLWKSPAHRGWGHPVRMVLGDIREVADLEPRGRVSK